MDANQRYKVAFVQRLAELGFDADQADGCASLALLAGQEREKVAIDWSTLALLGAIGVPVGAGLTGGYMLARAGDDPLAADRIKGREVMSTLEEQTKALERRNQARRMLGAAQPVSMPAR